MDYKTSGVNIDVGNRAVDRIRSLVKSTQSSQVLGDLGHFGAFFELPQGYKQPVLVSCTDGVGTKLKVAFEFNQFDTIGIDLVAMCVNDLICSGANPLFFLDYYACNQLSEHQVEAVIAGISRACKETGLSLVGGEMAEMGNVYQLGEFDLAGFCVGVVEKSDLIDGSQVSPGHYVYGLPSSGPHSNGFSLIRQILTPEICQKRGLNRNELLTPTTLYVNQINQLKQSRVLTAICNITGGGLCENISRVLPKNVTVLLEKKSWSVQPIFKHIQLAGQVSDDEMFRVFNMGIGMVVISPEQIPAQDGLQLIGKVIAGNGTTELI